VRVKAPIEAVFGAVTDPRRTLDWNPGLVEVADVAGLPPGIGTSWRQVAHYAGRTVSLTCRVVAFSPPHVGVLDVTGDYEGKVTTRCQPADGGTLLSQTIEFTPPSGIRGRLAMAVAHPLIAREVSHTLHRQKVILEREAGGADESGSSG